MKKITAIIIAGLLSGLSISSVSANDVTSKDGYIEKTETFETTDTNFNYEFEKTIEENGNKYNLVSVSYDIINSENLTKIDEVKRTVTYPDLYEQRAGEEKEITVVQDGNEILLPLDSITYEDTIIDNRTKLLTASTDFDYKTVEPTPPQTKTVTYYDEYTDINVTADLPLKDFIIADEWAWRADVSIPITFSLYDADYYALGDKLIPFNDDKPMLQGYENDLLNELNLDTSLYRITDVNWVGEPYTAGEVTYRDAVATGERYCANYIATYEDTVSLPDASGYKGVAVYKTEVEVLSGETQYTVKATALYEIDNTMKMIVTISIMLALFIILIVIILYLIAKKRRDKKKESVTVA